MATFTHPLVCHESIHTLACNILGIKLTHNSYHVNFDNFIYKHVNNKHHGMQC